MKFQPAHNTPYQQLKRSKVANTVSQNKVLTAVAAAGSGIAIAGAAAQSSTFARVTELGIAPALGMGMASLGALAAHDAVVNDLPQRPVFATAKATAGLVAGLGGVEIVGRSYDLPVLKEALSTPLGQAFRNGQAVLGVGLGAGGFWAGKLAAERLNQALEGQSRGRNLLLGSTAAATSVAATLGGVELVGRNFEIPVLQEALSGTARFLAQSGGAAVAGGLLLGAGAVQLGREAVHNFRGGGNDFLTLAETGAAVTAALGGAQLAGHGLGWKATEGLLTQHAPLLGSALLAGSGAAVVRSGLRSVQSRGLQPLNSLGLATGAALLPGGLGLGLQQLGLTQAASWCGQAALTGAGLGLGATSLALGRAAVNRGRQGDWVEASGLAAAATATTSAALLLGGHGLKIPALQRASELVLESTLEPLMDKVLSPAAQFLFNHPIAGGAALAVGVAGYLYARRRPSGDES